MTRIFTLTTLIMAASVAQAETEITDLNEDGVYSFDELVAAYPDLEESLFLQMDLNADGQIDQDELNTARGAGVLPG